MTDFPEPTDGQTLAELAARVKATRPLPPSRRRRPTDLATITDCRREMARLYRAGRDGAVPAGDAAKFAFVLMSLAALIRDEQFETRLTALEIARHAHTTAA
jgi:hypothetical protein